MRAELFSQMFRSAALSISSVSSLLDVPVPLGIPPWPGANWLVVMERTIPFIVRRTVAEPCWVEVGAIPLMTQFSRSRSSSRSRSCFW